MKTNSIFKTSSSKILKRMFLTAFYTTAVIELSQVGASLIDGLITSRFLGSMDMAAVGLAIPYFSIAGVISGCIATGMQTLCVAEVGRGKIENTKKIFSQAVIIGTILSAILTAILIIFASPVAGLLGAKGAAEDLRDPTATYLIGLAIGSPGFILSAIIAPIVQLDNGSKNVQRSAIACSVTDIVADLLAVKLGWGLLGIGLATSLSNYAQLVVLLWHFRNKESIIHFKVTRLERKTLYEIFVNGLEKLLRRGVNVIRPIILNYLIISLGGSIAMSVMSVRNSVNNFVEIPGAAIAGAVGLLTGLFFGEVNIDDIRQTAILAHRFDIVCSGISTVLLFIFAKPIANFYLGSENEGLELLVFAIYCLAIRSFFSTLTIARVSFLQSLRKIQLAQLLTIMLNLVYIVACAFILGKLFGAYGIMAAFPVSEIMVLVTVYINYAFSSKKINPTPDDYIGLDKSFYLGPGDVIDFPIRNKEEAALTSMQIMMFCKGHKLDSKKGYYAGLCAEEMAMLTIENGFGDKSSSHTIDIRVVVRDGDIVMRLRDNCQSFNIVKQAKLVEENDDPTSNPGIKLIYKTAKDISYYRTLETNNTIITI